MDLIHGLACTKFLRIFLLIGLELVQTITHGIMRRQELIIDVERRGWVDQLLGHFFIDLGCKFFSRLGQPVMNELSLESELVKCRTDNCLS